VASSRGISPLPSIGVFFSLAQLHRHGGISIWVGLDLWMGNLRILFSYQSINPVEIVKTRTSLSLRGEHENMGAHIAEQSGRRRGLRWKGQSRRCPAPAARYPFPFHPCRSSGTGVDARGGFGSSAAGRRSGEPRRTNLHATVRVSCKNPQRDTPSPRREYCTCMSPAIKHAWN